MTADIILAVVLAIAFIIGICKGFIKSIWNIAVWVITGIVVYMVLTPTVNFLNTTPLPDKIYVPIYEAIAQKNEITAEERLAELPQWLQLTEADEILNENIAVMSENIAAAVSQTIIKAIAAIALFILIRIILTVVFMILDIASKLPVISGVNRLFGGVFSVVSVMFIIYIVLGIAAVFANRQINEFIYSSTAVRYLFDNNVLLNIFM